MNVKTDQRERLKGLTEEVLSELEIEATVVAIETLQVQGGKEVRAEIMFSDQGLTFTDLFPSGDDQTTKETIKERLIRKLPQ